MLLVVLSLIPLLLVTVRCILCLWLPVGDIAIAAAVDALFVVTADIKSLTKFRGFVFLKRRLAYIFT